MLRRGLPAPASREVPSMCQLALFLVARLVGLGHPRFHACASRCPRRERCQVPDPYNLPIIRSVKRDKVIDSPIAFGVECPKASCEGTEESPREKTGQRAVAEPITQIPAQKSGGEDRGRRRGPRKVGPKQQTHKTGTAQHFDGQPDSVLPIPEQVQGLLQGERCRGPHGLGRGRSMASRLYGCDVPGWRRGIRGRENPRCRRVRQHLPQGEPCSKQAGCQGLAKTASCYQPASVAKTPDHGHRDAAVRRAPWADSAWLGWCLWLFICTFAQEKR